jgi:hypothetical protein
MHQSIPAATIPPRDNPRALVNFHFFRANAPPLGRKTKQMPHPRADKLVNFKDCTKLITCVLTICIYTSVNCSFGDLQKKENYRVHFR